MNNNNLSEGSFKSKVPSFPITARNIVSNLSGYFCRKGNRQLIEKNVQKMLFKRVSSVKKEEVNISSYFILHLKRCHHPTNYYHGFCIYHNLLFLRTVDLV